MSGLDRNSFLGEIVADPGNGHARLVYADWLEDQGDPQGEFIRLQCERETNQQGSSRNAISGTRESALLDANMERWAEPLLKLGIEKTAVGFRWGFIDAVSVSGKTAASHIAAIRSHCPLLRRLYINSATDWIDRVSGSPHLSGLIQIGLQGQLTSENVRHFFFDTPGLETLKAIDLGLTQMSDGGLSALLTAPQLSDILALDLNDCEVTARGLRQILSWRLASQLEWLNLRHNPIGDRGGKLIARTRRLPLIKNLDLTRTQLGGPVIDQLKSRWGDRLVC